ncbi:MAG: NAD-dependent epimerase/dehydratase family protein [Opitutaceae bacterium]
MRTIKNCKACVIGGAGFLGSHLVDHLIDDRGCDVLVLDNLINGHTKHIHRDATFVWHDIREGEHETARLLQQHGVRYVFNYAAEPYIPECFERPTHFFTINATAVLSVLNACKLAEVEGLLQVSSAEIYGDMKGAIKESDPVCPHSTYGVSKMAADGLVQVRWREAKVPAIAMRQFNCVGERETHEYVIPEIISQIAENGPTIRLGNNSTRDFQYAGDAVRMAVALLECGQFGEVYNMGSEECVTIYDLAKLIGELMGHESITIVPTEAKRRPWEIWHLQSDNSKLYGVIDTRPAVPLREALRRTINYYQQNGSRWDW